MVWRRLLSLVPLLLVVSFAVFCLELFLPGDAAVNLAGPDASEEQVQAIRERLDLDAPIHERYLRWMGGAVQGDFGESLFTRRSVATEIADRWAVTAQVVTGALVLSIVVSVPAGIVAGTRRGRWPDKVATVGSALGVAVPNFVLGAVLIVVFAVWLDWLPIAGYVPIGEGLVPWLRHMVLPVVAVSGLMIAELTRQLRSGLAETLEQDYTRTARAKGMPERTVVTKHALRLAAAPAVSVVGVQAARLFGGVVIVEQVFDLPGLGQLTVDAIFNRDLPVLQGVIPLAVAIAVVMTLLADLVRLRLDPSLRFRGGL